MGLDKVSSKAQAEASPTVNMLQSKRQLSSTQNRGKAEHTRGEETILENRCLHLLFIFLDWYTLQLWW